MVLTALSERHFLGPAKVCNLVTKIYIEHPNDEARFYMPTFEFLLRYGILSV